MARRVRIAVPATIRTFSPMTGTGNMWRHVLAGLATRTRLDFAEPGTPRRRGRRPPDVWLSDSGLGAIPVSEPVVVQVHEAGWDLPDARATLEPHFLDLVLEGRMGDAVRQAAQIITPSESARAQVVDHWDVDPAQVHAVAHGVDLQLFHPGRAGGADIVAGAGGKPDVPYVLFVSTVHPRKNLAALRDAMTELAHEGFPHQLVLVTSPAPDRADSTRLEEEAEGDLPGTTGRVVRLSGLTAEELAAVMAGAAAFCLPSLMEGFGLTALEAMSAGIPVVVSDRGSLPALVGDAGLVVAPTAEAVREGLATILDDPARASALAAAARSRAMTFTWDRTVDGWSKVLRLAADTAGGAAQRRSTKSRS